MNHLVDQQKQDANDSLGRYDYPLKCTEDENFVLYNRQYDDSFRILLLNLSTFSFSLFLHFNKRYTVTYVYQTQSIY